METLSPQTSQISGMMPNFHQTVVTCCEVRHLCSRLLLIHHTCKKLLKSHVTDSLTDELRVCFYLLTAAWSSFLHMMSGDMRRFVRTSLTHLWNPGNLKRTAEKSSCMPVLWGFACVHWSSEETSRATWELEPLEREIQPLINKCLYSARPQLQEETPESILNTARRTHTCMHTHMHTHTCTHTQRHKKSRFQQWSF